MQMVAQAIALRSLSEKSREMTVVPLECLIVLELGCCKLCLTGSHRSAFSRAAKQLAASKIETEKCQAWKFWLEFPTTKIGNFSASQQ